MRLHVNENPFPPEKAVGETLSQLSINRYPDPGYTQLKAAVIGYLNEQLPESLALSSQQVTFGNGSDELILTAMLSLLTPGDRVISTQPGFSEYQRTAGLLRLNYLAVDADEGLRPQLDLLLQQALAKDARLVILCSPDNPSGQKLSLGSIQMFLEAYEGYVLLDEAYIDFASEPQASLSLLNQYPQLLILRTFSKAWGLAGLRIGYLLGSGPLIQTIEGNRAPYNVNIASEAAVRAVLQAPETYLARMATLQKERQRLSETLRDKVEQLYPSEANFLLLKRASAQAIAQQLQAQGILVRAFSEPRLQDHLRVSLGTPSENDRFLEAFFALLEKEDAYDTSA